MQLRWQSFLGETFAALRHRNFRLFWFGQLISTTGNWMNTVAQGWLVLQLTNSAVALGTIGALQWAPVLLLTAVGGVLADRFDKRRVLLVTQSLLLSLAATLGLLTVTGRVQVWHVMAIALLTGIVNALDNPARQAFLVELVGKRDLTNAIALNSSVFNAARVVGPSIGGLVIAASGVGPAFLLNAASYLAVLLGLARMTAMPAPTPAKGRRLLADLAEGFRYLRGTPSVLWPIILIGVVGLFSINWNVILPLWAKHVLHVGPQGLGMLYTALGLGALAGGLTLAAQSGTSPRFRDVSGYAVAFCGLQLAAAAVPAYLPDLLLLTIAGFAMIRFTAGANSLVQGLVPDGLRARVMSVYFLVFGGSSPFGNEFAGASAATWGAPTALALGALLGGTFAAWVYVVHGRARTVPRHPTSV